jgi:hypothetical protein
MASSDNAEFDKSETPDQDKNLSPQLRVLKKYAFKPGQSGNPSGKPKGTLGLTATLRKAMARGGAEEAINAALSVLRNPNHRHFPSIFKEIYTRLEGQPKQELELTARRFVEGIKLERGSPDAALPLSDAEARELAEENVQESEGESFSEAG